MHEYKCTVVRIIDGDTVDVDIDLGFGVWMRKERVRMFGIDTPESRREEIWLCCKGLSYWYVK